MLYWDIGTFCVRNILAHVVDMVGFDNFFYPFRGFLI